MRTIHLKIRAGEKTCAESKGCFCYFLRSNVAGLKPRCALFEKPLFDADGDVLGWLQRLPECLAAEAGGVEPGTPQ